jgi:heparan-alpha-glucosaminide N-acetyltransferase
MSTLLNPTRTEPIPVKEQTTPPLPALAKPARLMSLDAYRGFIMLMMASSGLGIHGMVLNHPDIFANSKFWQFLGFQTDHVDWVGCSFWDLIQPSFMFMVGVAVPYSRASRKAQGQSEGRILLHSIWRSLVLVLLAVFLSSNSTSIKQTNWEFPNVLAQIGLGYTFLTLLAGLCFREQLVALIVIIAGYTMAFGLYPLPGPGFDWKAVGVPPNWPHLEGWFGHWDKNSNFAAWFDAKCFAGEYFQGGFLNLFPRPGRFVFNEGGYQTLNFIPSLATMILGLMAGESLRRPLGAQRHFVRLVAAGLACLAIGLLMGSTVCPIVKRIWTPSWAVYSSGWTFLMLAAFYGIIDGIGWRGWAFPFVVVGMNSIAMYCMSQLMRGWVRSSLNVHLGLPTWNLLEKFDMPWLATIYGPMFQNAAILLVFWLICLWLYRRKVFLRI